MEKTGTQSPSCVGAKPALSSGTQPVNVQGASLASASCTKVTEIRCETLSKISKISYRWTIHNFSFLLGEKLKSPPFSTPDSDMKWALEIYPDPLVKEYLLFAVHLLATNKPHPKIPTQYNLSIQNTKNKQIGAMKGQIQFFTGTGQRIWRINREAMLPTELLHEDKLIIICELSVMEECKHSVSNQSNVIRPPRCKLFEHLGALFESHKLSDVTVVVGEREFQAHKVILMAGSPVFAAMFGHEMKESRQNRVIISDFEPDVIKEVLEFIYTDKAPNVNTKTKELLKAADKYAVDRLKVMCEEELRLKTTVQTAVETLILADRYSAELLKLQTMNFIRSNAAEVMETTSWKGMVRTCPRLVDEVCRSMAKHWRQETGDGALSSKRAREDAQDTSTKVVKK